MTVSCLVSVFDRRDPKEKKKKRKRERDKAEHMRLCEPHFVHATVDELTDMSDLGPTKETVYVEFKVRRADNMKHKIDRCAEGNMTHGRTRCGRIKCQASPQASSGLERTGTNRSRLGALVQLMGVIPTICLHCGEAGAEWHRLGECKGWADMRAQIDEGVSKFQVPVTWITAQPWQVNLGK